MSRSSFSPASASLAVVAAITLARCGVVPPTLGSDIRTVEIKATTVAGRSVTVSATADGKLVHLTPREGARVEAGEPVAVLRNAALERDYELARAEAAVAVANLQRRTQPVPMTSSYTASRVENALQMVLENKRAKLERYQRLRKRHDVSEQELEDAQNEFAWAQRDYLTQTAEPAVLTDSNRSNLQLDLVKARADERAALERLDALRIVAPISGTVTAVRAVEGQPVYTRDALLDIIDLSTIEVRGEIAPDLLQYAQEGRPVDVKIYTVPPRMLHATVDHVLPATPNAAAPVVVVRLANTDGQLRPNTPAKISIPY